MKLMFNKTTYEGHWFNDDDEKPADYTEKIPVNAGVVFDEELNDWVPKPVIIDEIEAMR